MCDLSLWVILTVIAPSIEAGQLKQMMANDRIGHSVWNDHHKYIGIGRVDQRLFQKPALCQGTTLQTAQKPLVRNKPVGLYQGTNSVVPKSAPKTPGFSPCGIAAKDRAGHF
jgi:hypothetical protein